MQPKTRRMNLIAQLLAGRRFSNQEELARALGRDGVEVTQATLSRDLRALGVAKPAGDTLDRKRQLLDLRAFVNEVRVARNLAIVRTPPGHANGVARAIDLAEF